MHSTQPYRESQLGQAGHLDARRQSLPGTPGQDLCLPIQADLSAMLDGELDPAGVRRVTVHSDACSACRSFLDGIRQQVGLHRHFAAAMFESTSAPAS